MWKLILGYSGNYINIKKENSADMKWGNGYSMGMEVKCLLPPLAAIIFHPEMLITTTITSSICTLAMCIQPTFSSLAHHHHHPHHHHHLHWHLGWMHSAIIFIQTSPSTLSSSPSTPWATNKCIRPPFSSITHPIHPCNHYKLQF